MKKVSEGIYERQKNTDGTTSYLLQVMFQDHRYNKTVRCASLAQAKRARERFRVEVEDKRIDWNTIKWPELCDQWLEQYAKQQYKTSTYLTQKAQVEKRIRPAWKKQARKISRREIQSWINSLAEEVSPKTVRNYYSTVRRIFTWGIQKELLATSPCEYIDLPRWEKADPQYITIDTFTEVVKVLPNESIEVQVIISLAMFAGLRRGEILGLRWKDLDLNKNTFTVEQNLIQGQYGVSSYIDSPKTEAGRRTATLPQEVSDLLQELKCIQEDRAIALGDHWPDLPYVVLKQDGYQYTPTSLDFQIKTFREKYNLPKFTLHGLRHTHASLMAYLGASSEEIQHRLGHADKSTTENIYIHMFESFKERDYTMANKLDELIKNTKE